MNAILQNNAVLVISVLVLAQTRGVEGQGCKNVVWLENKDGFYLYNHTIQTLTTETQSMCRIMCYLHDSPCLSYNFHESTGTCDINDSDEFQHPNDLMPRAGYVFVGTENGCQNNPCPSNSIGCQANFTYKGGFKCLCPSGFTGPSCNRAPLQGTKERPAKSCLEILVTGNSLGTGEYWIDPAATGNPIKAYCDMDTDGGGWTIVKRTILPTGQGLPWLKLNDLNVIAEFNRTDVWVVPKTDAMLDIKNKMGFHQIHFYCYKKSVGRIVSIMTKNNTAGQDVVTYFTTPGVATVFPTACGSFDRLPNDTSLLSQNCDKWGTMDRSGGSHPLQNQWGYYSFHGGARPGGIPFQMNLPPGHFFGGSDIANEGPLTYCDDQFSTLSEPPSPQDTWQISVR